MELSEVINKYIKIYEIERTGWKIRGIEEPENVSTHELSCLLIAFAFLPNAAGLHPTIESCDDYNLLLILLLILIHDLGEVDIGDKIRGTKTAADKLREHRSVQNFLNAVKTNDPSSDLCDRLDELWVDMESGDPKNVNAKIAKEIDYIQGAYQYFIYCITGKAEYTKESCKEWFNDISDDKIQTFQGRKIRDDLIFKNPIFTAHATLHQFFREIKFRR